MNPQMKQRIDEKLAQLSDQSGAQILDFADFLASKESKHSSTNQEIQDAEEENYLTGVQNGLNEWSGTADEDAYRDIETTQPLKSFSPNT